MRESTENSFAGEGEPHVDGSLETDGSKAKLSSTRNLRGKKMAVHKCTISLEGAVVMDVTYLDSQKYIFTGISLQVQEPSYGRMGNRVPCPDSSNIKGPLIISLNVDFPKEWLKRSKRMRQGATQTRISAEDKNGLEGY